MKRMALFALAALTAACSELGIFSDPPEAVPAELDFASRLDTRGPLLERGVATISTDGGVVEIDGMIPVEGCKKLSATASVDTESRVVLRVRAAESLGPCPSVADINHEYTARILGLPAGEYRVHVIHAYPGDRRRDERVETEEVEIPRVPVAT